MAAAHARMGNRKAAAAAQTCRKCGGVAPLLTQVYCPVMAGDAVGGGHEATFHRTVFLFCCADGRCVAKHGGGACRALRGQLPRRNAHFSYEALPDLDTDSDDEGSGSEGGADASSWVRASEGGVGPSGQWPELELVVEPEEECLSNSASVEQLLQRYSAAEMADGAGQAHGLPAEAMPSAADLQFDPERRQWVSFQARCAAAPEQVLRHCRSTAAGAPLWPRKTPGAPRPPPACPRCGGERIFEYQVRRSLSRGSACVCEFVGVCVCACARARAGGCPDPNARTATPAATRRTSGINYLAARRYSPMIRKAVLLRDLMLATHAPALPCAHLYKTSDLSCV